MLISSPGQHMRRTEFTPMFEFWEVAGGQPSQNNYRRVTAELWSAEPISSKYIE